MQERAGSDVDSRSTSWFDQIREEHAAIRGMIRGIEAELDRLRAHPAQLGDPWRLPELTGAFRERLERHFELEEGGGLLGDARQYYDERMQEQVHALIAEHRTFERRVERMVIEVGSRFVPPATVQACFDREFRKLVDDLSRHEAAENALLAQLVWDATRQPG
jgi:iron-sulfur cluster repair protein YtfE (RIC family)